MKYLNKEISSLSNEDLTKAKATLDNMLQNVKEVQATEKFKKKFQNTIPAINPNFLQIRTEIENEISKRNKS